MKDILTMLRAPLALEASNVLVHRIAHWSNLGGAYADTTSAAVSVAIVFYAGWLVSRRTRRVAQAAVAGFVVWAFSLALVALLTTVELFLAPALPAGQGSAAIAGLVLSSILFLPGLIAVAVIAGLLGRKAAL